MLRLAADEINAINSLLQLSEDVLLPLPFPSHKCSLVHPPNHYNYQVYTITNARNGAQINVRARKFVEVSFLGGPSFVQFI